MEGTSDRYVFVRRVATGGMAEVWKARSRGLAGFAKDVAIKRLLPALSHNDQILELLQDEARLVATLLHPNIVQVLDFGQLEGEWFIAMEYVPGTNAASLLQRLRDQQTCLPLEMALYVAAEACKALGFAHTRRQPVVHRDISPDNVLVGFDGQIKVTDFGIAKVRGGLAKTEAGEIKGKCSYMSPEQVAHGEAVDARSDLFSLGLTLYELVTGKRLFDTGSQAERLARIAIFQGLDEDSLRAVPVVVRDIIARALQREPDDRYLTASEMESDLIVALGAHSSVIARQALATLVQRLFANEMRLEELEEMSELAAPIAVAPAPLTERRKQTKRKLRFGRRSALLVAGTGLLVTSAALVLHQTGRQSGAAVAATASVSSNTSIHEDAPTPTSELSPALVSSPSPSPIATAVDAGEDRIAVPKRVVVATKKKTKAKAKKAKTQEPDTEDAKPKAPVEKKVKIVRAIPVHPAALLDGCTGDERARLKGTIASAIRLGAPTYNRGDAQSCYQIYKAIAERLALEIPGTCPGPPRALRDGLARAAKQGSAKERAWAMRDTFDGLTQVVTRAAK